MAKAMPDAFADAAFDYIRTRVTQVTACNAEPTSYAEATSTYKLAGTAITSTDLTIADDTSGRKVTMTAKSAVSVSTTGTASHIAYAGSTGSTLLYVTTCTTQSLTTGNTVNFPAWKINIQDPS